MYNKLQKGRSIASDQLQEGIDYLIFGFIQLGGNFLEGYLRGPIREEGDEGFEGMNFGGRLSVLLLATNIIKK